MQGLTALHNGYPQRGLPLKGYGPAGAPCLGGRAPAEGSPSGHLLRGGNAIKWPSKQICRGYPFKLAEGPKTFTRAGRMRLVRDPHSWIKVKGPLGPRLNSFTAGACGPSK